MSLDSTAEVLVIDTAPDRAELESVLGPAPAAALAEELRAQVVSFARHVANGPFHEADPQESLSDAVTRAFGQQSKPLLVVWPELARISQAVAAAALEDLRTGADVVLGPVLDGGLYLLGLRQPLPELLTRLEASLDGGELATAGLAAASEMCLEIGLLRVERALRTASDVDAALADPLTPEDIRRALSTLG